MPQLFFNLVNYDQQSCGWLHEVSINISLTHSLCVDVTQKCINFHSMLQGYIMSSNGTLLYASICVQRIWQHLDIKISVTHEEFELKKELMLFYKDLPYKYNRLILQPSCKMSYLKLVFNSSDKLNWMEMTKRNWNWIYFYKIIGIEIYVTNGIGIEKKRNSTHICICQN